MSPVTKPTSVEHQAIPPGDHVITLIEVIEHINANPYFKADQPEGPQNQRERLRWAWIFHSDAEDEEGRRYEYLEWTGPTYGDHRANLTKLYAMIVPNLSEKERETLDTTTLHGRRFRAKITMQKNAKDELVPKALFLEPLAPTTSPATSAPDMDMPDFGAPDPESDRPHEPLDEAMQRSISEATAVVDPARKDEAKFAVATKLRELGYGSWPDFMARGKRDYVVLLELLRGYDRSHGAAPPPAGQAAR